MFIYNVYTLFKDSLYNDIYKHYFNKYLYTSLKHIVTR